MRQGHCPADTVQARPVLTVALPRRDGSCLPTKWQQWQQWLVAPRSRAGPRLDAMKPDFQCVITRWNLGFMAIRQTPPAWIVILMVPVCPESGFQRV